MKRKIALILAIALMSTGIVFAASVNGTFAGLSVVNVIVNGKTVSSDVPGVVLEGRTMLPARAVAESLNAAVSWDKSTMTATIVKPDVNMNFVDEINKNSDGSWSADNVGIRFDTVGKEKWIDLFFTVGPLAKATYQYRIVVLNPAGEVLKTSAEGKSVIDSSGIVGEIVLDELTYQKAGNYTVQFQMKFNDQFVTVEDTVLVVE